VTPKVLAMPLINGCGIKVTVSQHRKLLEIWVAADDGH
jgi:hypothetical protein